jgi:hypothetical protein
MKRKIIKFAKKIKKYCSKSECDKCDFADKLGGCIFIDSPSPDRLELPPLPKKKKKLYVKSMEEILKIAAKERAIIDSTGIIRFPNWEEFFTPSMSRYCGKKKPVIYFWHPEFLEEREE